MTKTEEKILEVIKDYKSGRVVRLSGIRNVNAVKKLAAKGFIKNFVNTTSHGSYTSYKGNVISGSVYSCRFEVK